MKWVGLLCLVVSTLACANHPPPTLTPSARAAWYGLRAIQALDVLRDTAIAANAQTPPLVSTDTTRKIVTFHESAITTIHNVPLGWAAAVETGLGEVVKDLPPNDRRLFGPYIQLIQITIGEVRR